MIATINVYFSTKTNSTSKMQFNIVGNVEFKFITYILSSSSRRYQTRRITWIKLVQYQDLTLVNDYDAIEFPLNKQLPTNPLESEDKYRTFLFFHLYNIYSSNLLSTRLGICLHTGIWLRTWIDLLFRTRSNSYHITIGESLTSHSTSALKHSEMQTVSLFSSQSL